MSDLIQLSYARSSLLTCVFILLICSLAAGYMVAFMLGEKRHRRILGVYTLLAVLGASVMLHVRWNLDQMMDQWMLVALVFFALAITILGARHIERLINRFFSQPSSMSVQQSFELPSTGICFHEPNGQPLMANNCMEQLCIKLTGEHLLDANELWDTVRAVSRDRFIDANGDELYQVVLDEPTLARVESSGSTRAFAFTRRDFMMSGFPIFELKATDVSEQFALQRELEADNSRARDLNRRLAEYGSNVDAIIREREVLSARMAVHDEVGRNLIAAKRWLQANPAGAGTPIEAQAAQEAAQLQRDMTQSLRLMLASDDHAPSGTADNLQRLLDAAAAVGLSLEIEGEMPPIGSSARELLLAAMRECTTNAVRHANASVLRVRVDSLPDGYVARLDNNGTAPDGPVHEGGGLSSLRRLVEPMGGSMDLQWEPGFLLTLSVPNE